MVARLAAVGLVVLIAGCTTVPKGSFCQVSEPIRLPAAAVDQLTPDQARKVLAHNRLGGKLCGWRP